MRVVAIWFPDWPVQALSMSGEASPVQEVGIVRTRTIVACSQAARRAGVRRGMRAREAQAVAPELTLVEDNPDRDARAFEPIAAGLDEVTASVEVLRPGLVLVSAGPVARYHGGEDTAAELLLDAASRQGLDCQLGIADELPTAVLAARSGVGVTVAPGDSRRFLDPIPVSAAAGEVALGCDPGTAATLEQVGVRTLGNLAALSIRDVSTRFGAAGARLWRLARAEEQRGVLPTVPRPDLSASVTPDEPIERVDAAAFLARSLAAQLHLRLRNAGVVCVQLTISADLGQHTLTRTWRTREPLTEAATAQRVRWQLDGWLTRLRGRGAGHGRGGNANVDPPAAALTSLTLTPTEVARPGPWEHRDESASAAIERLSATLGSDAVLQPTDAGGRGVAERIRLAPHDAPVPASPSGEWPGRIPPPLPALLAHPSSRIQLVTELGEPVCLIPGLLLNGAPVAARWGKKNYRISGWAGPWPVSALLSTGTETAGEGARTIDTARLQFTAEPGPEAWLVAWNGTEWHVEARYG